MDAVVRKWGNSLGLLLPLSIARELHINDGSHVTINKVGDEIHIKPLTHTQTLELLLSEITPENSHDLVDWGEDLGGERFE
ncbi:Antitoxin MazE (plasmid) [Piscirickettsia salmonis]|uniref:AbrB/MazE/SpoVT family DNA-binding domain-containing protein n=1 Tax=Piscirickettsia salmonis TaxID=1238 RepID=UPI0012B887A8|nr:AbrB/MazE/SpoVT family DNA-binding domain-containing protein [Piscirickettsia salmonis]QGP52171.1 Antitoxin MazE [Piscirickettsia salmonis]